MIWQIVGTIGGIVAIVLIDILTIKYWENIDNYFKNKKWRDEE